jgi:hypothetical protein
MPWPLLHGSPHDAHRGTSTPPHLPVPHPQARRAFPAFADVHGAAARRPEEGAALSAMLAPAHPVGAGLVSALAQCKTAVGHMEALQRHRGEVVEARKEALAGRMAGMAAAREALTAGVTARMAAADSDFLAQLRASVSGAGAGSAAGEGGGAAPAAAAGEGGS